MLSDLELGYFLAHKYLPTGNVLTSEMKAAIFDKICRCHGTEDVDVVVLCCDAMWTCSTL
jgi:hypothetical protein